MSGRDSHRRRNAFRPAALGIAGVTLVHLLAKNVAAALLSVSLSGFPSGGIDVVDQFLLDRLENTRDANPAKVRGVPEAVSDFNIQ